jgi:hypothetical protein
LSHYSTAGVAIKSPACLIAALEELGLTPEYHAEGVQLFGYQGDARAEKAHVVIPRKQVGSASNDIGFFFGVNGCEAIVSDYDKRRHDAAWLGKVAQLAGVHAALGRAKSLGHRAERRLDEKGRQQVVLTGGRW